MLENESSALTNKETPNLFFTNKVFPFSQLAWPRVKLIWGWVYWFGTPWIESDETAFHFLHNVLNHAYWLSWPRDTFTRKPHPI